MKIFLLIWCSIGLIAGIIMQICNVIDKVKFVFSVDIKDFISAIVFGPLSILGAACAISSSMLQHKIMKGVKIHG